METSEEDLSDPDIEKERKWQQTAEKLKNLFYDLGNKARRIWDKIKAVYRRIMKIPEDMEKLSGRKMLFAIRSTGGVHSSDILVRRKQSLLCGRRCFVC